ncbi:hypothetical protein [Marinobacter sp. SS21]|uniref:hypothetical protein n=1 Tax=Marinobacter sp. SS21 TaxID=2979460 RepID=UPI00232CF6E8|nr:hypothetical protein [Marinobacter sp. SS21]MDC0661208.1 hypothetical protein [Marinobacter sp. SS21]
MKTIWKRRMLALTVPLVLLAGTALAGDSMDDDTMMDDHTMMDDGMASHDTMMESDHGKMADDMDHGMTSDTMDGKRMDEPMMEDQGMSESGSMN